MVKPIYVEKLYQLGCHSEKCEAVEKLAELSEKLQAVEEKVAQAEGSLTSGQSSETQSSVAQSISQDEGNAIEMRNDGLYVAQSQATMSNVTNETSLIVERLPVDIYGGNNGDERFTHRIKGTEILLQTFVEKKTDNSGYLVPTGRTVDEILEELLVFDFQRDTKQQWLFDLVVKPFPEEYKLNGEDPYDKAKIPVPSGTVFNVTLESDFKADERFGALTLEEILSKVYFVMLDENGNPNGTPFQFRLDETQAISVPFDNNVSYRSDKYTGYINGMMRAYFQYDDGRTVDLKRYSWVWVADFN